MAVANRVDPSLFYGVAPESHILNDGEQGVHTYWAAAEVSAFGTVPEGMGTLTIPPGRYAVGSAKVLSINAEGYGFKLYKAKRQAPTPPYEEFDFDIYVSLA